jgi:hypothetical protein
MECIRFGRIRTKGYMRLAIRSAAGRGAASTEAGKSAAIAQGKAAP